MSNKMTAHEWEIACGDLKAENDRIQKEYDRKCEQYNYQLRENSQLRTALGKASASAEGFRKAIREAKRTGSGFNELFDGVDKSDSVPVNLGPYKIDPHEHGEHEREEAKPEGKA